MAASPPSSRTVTSATGKSSKMASATRVAARSIKSFFSASMTAIARLDTLE